MLKKILYVAAGFILVFAIFKVNDIYHSFTARETAEESVVLLESIRMCTSLVAQRDIFQRYMIIKIIMVSYYHQKKAPIRVKAKVSVEYD
ncbi:hypothetical protein MASR1M65_21390 [Saprospiraceae bacterium]